MRVSFASLCLFACLQISHSSASPAQEKQPAPAGGVTEILSRKVALAEPFKGSLKDAFEMITEKFGLPIVLDVQKNNNEAGDGVENLKAMEVIIPKLDKVRTEVLLRILCDQAKVGYLVEKDYVRIVPVAIKSFESGILSAKTDENDEAPQLSNEEILRSKPLTQRALVTATYKDRSLQSIIDEISESTGATVILAPQGAALTDAKTFSVRFANTPVIAAVRTLTEMADLGLIADANVLLVTTRERAAERAKEDKVRKPAPQPQFVPGLGMGVGGVPLLPAQPDYAAELAQIKLQNEQLKKQLDEIQKSLKK